MGAGRTQLRGGFYFMTPFVFWQDPPKGFEKLGAYSNGSNVERYNYNHGSLNKDLNSGSPRSPKTASYTPSPRHSLTPTTIMDRPSKSRTFKPDSESEVLRESSAPLEDLSSRSTPRQSLPKNVIAKPRMQDQYDARRLSRNDPSPDKEPRSHSALPNPNFNQLKTSTPSGFKNGLESRPIPSERNLRAFKDPSSRKFPLPSQMDRNEVAVGHRSNDEGDNFFEKVLEYERNRSKNSSIKNEPTVGDNAKTNSSVRFPVAQETLRSRSNKDLANLENTRNEDHTERVIYPSKHGANVQKSMANDFDLKTTTSPPKPTTAQSPMPMQNDKISRSPNGVLDLENKSRGEYVKGVSPLYGEKSPSLLPGGEKMVFPTPKPRRLNPSAKINAESPKSPCTYSDKKVVIIDMGHYYVRVGVLRDQSYEPYLCLPNSIAVTSKGLLFGDAVPQVVDPDANQDLANTSIISPLRLSQVTEPVLLKGLPIQKMFLQNIIERLNLTDKDYKLLLCLPTRASALRPYFLDYFLGPTAAADQRGFDCFQTVATISAFRAALQITKVSTSLVIVLNADLEIIPIAEGTLLENGRSTTALYGETALRFFMEELVSAGVDLTEQEIGCFGHYIYQKAAYIENHKTECKDVVVDLAQYTPYPLEKRLKVPAELRRKASDALLRPENAPGHDGELPPFKKLLGAAIQSCALDVRNSIWSNVIVIGEFAEIEGFRERLEEEVCGLIPEGAGRPNVQVAPNAAGCVYGGASFLAALLQGPYAPVCPWLRFLDGQDWSAMRQEANSTGGITATSLLSRLNKDCVWP
ncbi:hypothetical protein Aperf_G00000040897 [Anoplocephala perfoliata]